MRNPVSRRIAIAAVAAAAMAVAFALLAEKCGAIHGSPRCGPLSYAAVPFTIAALALESLIFGSPQNDQVVRLILWLVASVIAVLIASLFLWLRSSPDRRKVS